MNAFFRYPHTPHLFWFGTGTPRDDKVLAPEESRYLLSREVVVEEKLDGANLGLSIDESGQLRAQNRGQFLRRPFGGQFGRLNGWYDEHEAKMSNALKHDWIAFGEWCAARHSLNYDALPDWWVMFDIYDRTAERFWSSTRRDNWAQALGLITPAVVFRGNASLSLLEELMARKQSQYRDGPMEGLVVRVEDGDWLELRAKLVRSEFTQSIDTDVHWRKRSVQWNRLSDAA